MSAMSEIHANVVMCRNAAADLIEVYLKTENDHYAEMAKGWMEAAEIWERMAE